MTQSKDGRPIAQRGREDSVVRKATSPARRTTRPRSSASAAPEKAASGKEPAKPEAGKKDVVLVHGVTPDGRGLEVIRQRDDQVETGALRPLEHGKPIQGEVVSLEPRKDFPLVCDVKVEVPASSAPEREPRASRSGPAQVASDRYRKNWDTIWKNRDKRRLPN